MRRDKIMQAGEIADLLVAYDWASTSLGPSEGWSEALWTTLNLVLCSPFPSKLCWGEELILLYNDAAIPSLAAIHPAAFGTPYRQAIGEAWDFIGPDVEACFFRGEAPVRENILIPILKEGRMEDSYWTYALVPVFDQGKIAGIYESYRNTTANVLASRELRESEERASRILQSIGDAVIVTDADTRVVRMNPIAEQLTGWSMHEARGRPLSEVFQIIDETSRELIVNPAEKVRSLQRTVSMAEGAVLVARDGTETYIADSAAPIPDEAGQLSGIVLVFQSVAERKAAERFLRQSEERLRLALAAADGVGSWDWDVANDVCYADPGFQALYRVDPAVGVAGAPISLYLRHIHPEDREQVAAMVAESVRDGGEFRAEYRIAQADGSVRWVVAVGRCSLASSGAPQRFSGVAIEMTERKRIEEALRASEERLRIAAETAHLGIWELDLASGHIESSRLCKANLGRAEDDVYDYATMLASVHPEEQAALEMVVRKAAEDGSVFRSEFRVLWPDGSLHWIIVSGSVTPAESADSPRMVGVTLDVTDRHLAAQALMQSEKLAAVGRLASSIAHEINNPLESVTNLLYLARKGESSPRVREYLEIADRELRRVSVIANQTLRFHRQSTAPRSVSTTDLFESVLSIYQGRIVNSGITVQERQRASRQVDCFDGEIRQVLSNLVGNSIDAMHPAGGQLSIRSREASNWMTGEKGVLLTVADTGSGIGPQTMKRIFEPFFSTKGIAGSGLGLWVSQEITARHRGTLRVRSSQQGDLRGTVSTLFLPYKSASH